MNEYNTGSTTLYDIYKQKAKLLSFVCNSDVKGTMEKRCTLREAKFKELDKVLYKHYLLWKRL